MKRGFYSGTFDPPTLAHKNLIQKAANLCDELIVGIGINKDKPTAFLTLEERKQILRSFHPGLQVLDFSGLVIQAASTCQANFIIRGLRGPSTFEKERQMAIMNQKMSGLDTVFLLTDPEFSHVSSSLARELASFGRHLTGLVPDEWEEVIYNRLSKG